MHGLPLLLTTEHDRDIRAHGAQDYPHECCGFLIGRVRDGEFCVVKTAAAANARTDSPRNRFEIDPLDLMRMDKAARAEKLSVIGFYHSHPDAPARPSEYDREHAWPGYCYIIVSVAGGTPQEITSWRLREDRTHFESDTILIEENGSCL